MQQSTPKVLQRWFLDLRVGCKSCHRAAGLRPSPGEQSSCFMTGNFIKSAAASQMRYCRVTDSCFRCLSLSCPFASESPPQHCYFSALKLLQNQTLPTSLPFPLLFPSFSRLSPRDSFIMQQLEGFPVLFRGCGPDLRSVVCQAGPNISHHFSLQAAAPVSWLSVRNKRAIGDGQVRARSLEILSESTSTSLLVRNAFRQPCY